MYRSGYWVSSFETSKRSFMIKELFNLNQIFTKYYIHLTFQIFTNELPGKHETKIWNHDRFCAEWKNWQVVKKWKFSLKLLKIISLILKIFEKALHFLHVKLSNYLKFSHRLPSTGKRKSEPFCLKTIWNIILAP